MAQLKLDIIVDDKGTATIKGFGDAIKGVGGDTSGLEKSTMSLGSSLLKLGAAVGGIYVIKQAFGAAKDAVSDWVAAAKEAEKADTNLASVIKSTGASAGYTFDQLDKMASGLMAVTTVDDDVIKSGMAVLSTFKQIRGEGFERATQAAMDMSQIIGTDLQSSIKQIGKAMNDPISSLGALTKAGVQFTQTQEDQIKAMAKSGDMMGAQNIILAELESKFGGAATAAAETFGGAQLQLANNLENVKEELGFVITKNQFFIELLHLASGKLQEFGAWVQNNRTYLMELAKSGVLYLADTIIFAVKVLKFFHEGWLGIKLAGTMALAGIGILLENSIKTLRLLLTPMDLIFQGLVKLGTIKVNPFDKAQEVLENFKLASFDSAESILQDMAKTDAAYNVVIDTMGDMRNQVAAIGVTQAQTTQTKILPALNAEADARGKLTKEQVKAQKDACEKIADLYVKEVMTKEEQAKNWYEAQLDYINENIKDEEKRARAVEQLEAVYKEKRLKIKKDEDKEEDKINKERLDKEEKLAGDRLDAYKSMYADLHQYAYDNYEIQVELIRKQGAEYIKLTGDVVTATAWMEQKIRETWISMAKESDSYGDGVRAAFMEMEDNAITWGQIGYETTKTTFDAMESTISQFGKDIWQGELKSWKEYWDSFCDAIVFKWIDMLAEMAAEWIAKKGLMKLGDLIGLDFGSIGSLIGTGLEKVGLGAAAKALGLGGSAAAASGLAGAGGAAAGAITLGGAETAIGLGGGAAAGAVTLGGAEIAIGLGGGAAAGAVTLGGAETAIGLGGGAAAAGGAAGAGGTAGLGSATAGAGGGTLGGVLGVALPAAAIAGAAYVIYKGISMATEADYPPGTYHTDAFNTGQMGKAFSGPMSAWKEGEGFKSSGITIDAASNYDFAGIQEGYKILQAYVDMRDAVAGLVSSNVLAVLNTVPEAQRKEIEGRLAGIDFGYTWFRTRRRAAGLQRAIEASANEYYIHLMDKIVSVPGMTDILQGTGLGAQYAAERAKLYPPAKQMSQEEMGKYLLEQLYGENKEYAIGTGISGLPYTGYFGGHEGEIILNPDQSRQVRQTITGESGGNAGARGLKIEINSPLVYIDGNLIANEAEFDRFVEEIDYRLHKLAQLEH
jgi:hypothetical protein